MFDDLLRQSNLPRYLNGEATAGATDGQLKQRPHLMAVVEHRTVDHAVVTLGKVFQVLVVGGDDGPCLLLAELLQHALGDGAANLRLSAGAHLVDEDKRTVGGLTHHHLHIHQMRRIGREVILQALLVADVNHHIFKYTAAAARPHGDAQSGLQHILQQSDGLQTHRLTAGVGTGDNQHALLGLQHDVEGHDAVFQMELKQRMARPDPVDEWRGLHLRLKGIHRLGQPRLGLDEIDLSQESERVEYLTYMGPDAGRHHREDADDLLPFLGLEFPDVVVGLDDLGGLNIDGAAGGALVVDDALYLPLHRRHDGNDQPAVAQRRRHVFIHDAVALGRPQDAVEDAGDGTLGGR